MVRHSSTKAGRIAEFFACGVIEDLGWQTSLCQQDGVDLIAFKDNEYIRVQVKGSSIKKSLRNNGLQFIMGLGTNKRLPSIKDYDIACMVSTYHRRCWFVHVCNVQRKTIRRPKSFYENSELEYESWEKAVDIFREIKRNDRSKF